MKLSIKICTLLALATLGSTAIACGSSGGSSGGGSTTTDTATADTGSTADTAATVDTGTTGGDTATATDTTTKADGTTMADATATGDTTTTGDSTTTAETATAGAGCTGATDQAYLKSLSEDKAKADKFAGDVKACTLSNTTKPDEASAAAAIGACVVKDKGHPITEVCGGCYGIRGYCTFKNCVANSAEASTSGCLADPGGESCTKCADKYGCIKKSEDCKAGK